MSDIELKKLDELLEVAAEKGKKVEKILLGYKAYVCLMGDTSFHDEVMNSAINPNKRKYKKHKIKVTQDEYQFELKYV